MNRDTPDQAGEPRPGNPTAIITEPEAAFELFGSGGPAARARLQLYVARGLFLNARKRFRGGLYWPTREHFDADVKRVKAIHAAQRATFDPGAGAAPSNPEPTDT